MPLINKEMERQFALFLFNDIKLSTKRQKHIESQSRLFFDFYRNKEFNRNTFNEYVQFLKDRGLKNSTINTYIVLGKHYDTFSNTNCLIDYRYFKKEIKVVDTLTPDEIKKLAEVKISYGRWGEYLNSLYYLVIMFLGVTGARIDECLSLTRKDIISDPPAVIFRDTKNREERIVPIPPFIFKQLTSFSTNYLLFPSYEGRKLFPQVVNRELKRRAVEIGIKKHIYCHLFRHSYITTMRRNGVSIADIAKIVGHKDINSTMHYMHFVIEDLVNIIYHHPLLVQYQTFEIVKNKFKNTLNFINKDLFHVQITENSHDFALVIKSH